MTIAYPLAHVCATALPPRGGELPLSIPLEWQVAANTFLALATRPLEPIADLTLMATRSERERLARALKDAQRRPGNRRCADCVEKAPNYCQLQFRTFICSNCAAVHREMFSPKLVKSVSMAEFTTDEVKAMRAGGNEAARAVGSRV